MDSRKLDSYVQRLKDHNNFLEGVLLTREEHKSHYLKKDIRALMWAIEYIEDTQLDAADHLTKWREKQWVK